MKISFLMNDDIQTLTGGYIYNRYICEGLKNRNHDITVVTLNGKFPQPDPHDLEKCLGIIRAIPDHSYLIIDSLILGTIPEILCGVKSRLKIVGLVHLPVSADFLSDEPKMSDTEIRAMQLCNLLIVTGNYMKNFLVKLGINPDKIRVLMPGTENYPVKKDFPALPYHLLCIANYTRNKNQLLLIRALNRLKEYSWKMNFYGTVRDRDYFAVLQKEISGYHPGDRIFLHQELERDHLSEVYLSSDLFIFPSVFETFGMVLTEALAHGLPVITSVSGGIPDAVPSSMGLFSESLREDDFTLTLKKVFEKPEIYERLVLSAGKFNRKAVRWETVIRTFEEYLFMIE